MVTTTVCLALVSVDDLGFDTLMTFGFAKVDTIKKNNNKINMKKPGPENRLFWDNEARLRSVGKGMNSLFRMEDLSGDGKITKKDVLIGRGVIKKDGSPLNLKDACYRKVKASYKVFPSAYASGAIAKCRKNKK